MKKEYLITQEQLELISHYKRMFESHASTLQTLCDSEKSDIVYGFELGRMHYHLRECFIGMMELENEINEQDFETYAEVRSQNKKLKNENLK